LSNIPDLSKHCVSRFVRLLAVKGIDSKPSLRHHLNYMGRPRKDEQNNRKRPAWRVVLAERDANGEWQPTGEPLPPEFENQSDAFDCSMRANRWKINQRFDWVANPPVGYVVVRFNELGRLRTREPDPLPAELPAVLQGLESEFGLASVQESRDDRGEDEDGHGDGGA
jgi:hypothetical protein